MADINLLPVEEKAQERVQALQKKLSFLSIAALISTAIFTMITLVFFTGLVSTRNELIAAAGDVSGRIERQKKIEELLVVTKSKAAAASNILDARVDHADTFQKLSELIPQNVYFSDMKFSAGKLVVSGKAKTSADMAGLVSSFLSEKGSELISSVTVDSLGSDETGEYQFSLTMGLVK
ncbi:PilN domain-containing protein [Candidatus Curtissbacteria bacterium]|nr:PilN domain-containing protein [Candidatus Curtissbacteria bacterium]